MCAFFFFFLLQRDLTDIHVWCFCSGRHKEELECVLFAVEGLYVCGVFVHLTVFLPVCLVLEKEGSVPRTTASDIYPLQR